MSSESEKDNFVIDVMFDPRLQTKFSFIAQTHSAKKVHVWVHMNFVSIIDLKVLKVLKLLKKKNQISNQGCIWNGNLPITKRPALPPELQPLQTWAILTWM